MHIILLFVCSTFCNTTDIRLISIPRSGTTTMVSALKNAGICVNTKKQHNTNLILSVNHDYKSREPVNDDIETFVLLRKDKVRQMDALQRFRGSFEHYVPYYNNFVAKWCATNNFVAYFEEMECTIPCIIKYMNRIPISIKYSSKVSDFSDTFVHNVNNLTNDCYPKRKVCLNNECMLEKKSEM